MAKPRKVGSKWLVEVRRKGVSLSKTFATKQEAAVWAVNKEYELGAQTGGLPNYTLRDAFDKYAREVSPSHKGHRWEVVRLEKFKRDPIANVVLRNLTHDDIEAWMRRHSHLGNGSINRELNMISAVLSTCRKRWKWMTHEVMRDVQRKVAPAPRDRRISDEERDRLLAALDFVEGEARTARQQIAIAFILALESAMRQGEIWGLIWGNVYLSERYVILPETKNGTRRNVPLSKRAAEVISWLPKQGETLFTVSQATAGVMFRRAVELAGYKDLRFHDARHEAVTRLAKKLDVLELARVVGHRDPRSLMIYYNATAAEIAKKLD